MKNCPECNNQCNDDCDLCPSCGYGFQCERNELQKSIELYGVLDTWQEKSKNDARIHNIIDNIRTVVGILLVIISLTFLITSIVIGVTSNSNYETIKRLDTFMVASIVFILIFLITHEISEAILKYFELDKCSTWIKKNNLDALKSPALNEYQSAKRKKATMIAHNLDITYASVNQDYVNTRFVGYIIDIVIRFILYVIGGVSAYYFIKFGYILGTNDTAFNIIFGCILSIAIFAPPFVTKIVTHIYTSPAEKWYLNEKNK